MREIWQPNEEGWFDIDLDVVSSAFEAHRLVVVAKGIFRGAVVGLKVSFRNDLKPGIVSASVDRSAFASDGIMFESIGEESDRLLDALANLYGMRQEIRRFSSGLAAVSLALEERPIDFELRYIRLKAFFHHESGPDKYAELFVNLDLPAKRLEHHEKDEEYRRNVVSALSAASTSA